MRAAFPLNGPVNHVIMCQYKQEQGPETGEPKRNEALINIVNYRHTSAFPTMTCENVCR